MRRNCGSIYIAQFLSFGRQRNTKIRHWILTSVPPLPNISLFGSFSWRGWRRTGEGEGGVLADMHKLKLRKCLTSLPAQLSHPAECKCKSLHQWRSIDGNIKREPTFIVVILCFSGYLCGLFWTHTTIFSTHIALSCHRMFDVRRMKYDSLIKWNYIFIAIYVWVRWARTTTTTTTKHGYDELSKLKHGRGCQHIAIWNMSLMMPAYMLSN